VKKNGASAAPTPEDDAKARATRALADARGILRARGSMGAGERQLLVSADGATYVVGHEYIFVEGEPAVLVVSASKDSYTISCQGESLTVAYEEETARAVAVPATTE
jgi:hypothetical protein